MVSQDFIDKEQSQQRKPVELFHFWTDSGTQHWYYTSGDVSVVYNTNTYQPAPISRAGRSMDMQLSVSKLNIKVDRINQSIQDYLVQIVPETIWVEVFKLHREQAPLEALVIFVGQVSKPTFDGVNANIECVGFEKFLQQNIPTMRYQPSCNHALFDSGCGVDKATYELSATLMGLSSNGLELTSTDFEPFDDGHFNLGWVEFGQHRRVVTSHVGSIINIQFGIAGLTGTSAVKVYPGCDKSMATCRDKYSNLGTLLDRFFGFPYIPVDNPTAWA